MNDTLRTPGAIDLHVHLREPGDNTSETIESGTRAALLGGFVLVADMPNNPGKPVWCKERLDTKIQIAEKSAWIPTAFYAGSQPESDNVGELERMAPGAIGLKLYGDPTTGNVRSYEADDFEDIVEEWHRVAPKKPIMFHSGQDNLEDMIDLVADRNDHHLHVCHVNDLAQVSSVIKAKDFDLPVTCGVCPHHLLKTSHDYQTQGAFAEMNPPLASQSEVKVLISMLKHGDIDVIETDFAPHSKEYKYKAEHEGSHCYGVPGIEHVMPLLFYQVRRGLISLERLIEVTNTVPAKILGIQTQSTNLVEWDISDGAYQIEEKDIISNCGWTPYVGMLALGRLNAVIIGGKTVVEEGRLIRHHSQIIENQAR